MGARQPQNGAGQAGAAGGSGPDPVRVIVVGRTGLDGRLRLDPDLELVRVRSRLEAIGEVAGASGPERTVVIVGPEGGGGPPGFAEALRRADPGVRIIAAGADAADEVAGCDAVVLPDAGADVLRRAVRGETRGTSEGFSDVVHPRASAPAAPALDDHAEERVLEALVQGRDPTPAIMAEMRRRLGTEAEFRAGEAESGEGVPVVFSGRRLGFLRAPGWRPEALAAPSAWLARWIALRDQHAQLREAAFTDPLTGAYNRRFFDRFLLTAIESAQRDRRAVTVLVLDVDDFKTYNDRYGHAAGDEILCETVRLLASVIRPSDRVCRIGGDEFGVIFHEPEGPRSPTSRPPTDVFQIADRFQRAVRDARFPKLGAEAPGTLTISGGLASYPWDGRTPEELLARADELAMQSKRQGKNAITFGPDAERVDRDTR